VRHKFVFFTADGAPFETVYLPYNRWREVMETLPVRYRKPYNRRHSYISWRLMIGHNRLLVALEDGHSVATMERTYAAWTKGAKPEDVELIKAAMAGSPERAVAGTNTIESPLQSPGAGIRLAPSGPIEGTAVATMTTESVSDIVVSACLDEGKQCRSDLAGVEGLFGPDGPHPFGAALRAFKRPIALRVRPRHATERSDRRAEPYGRYPSRRDTWPRAIQTRRKVRADELLAGVEGLFGPGGLTPSGPPSGRSNDRLLFARDHDTRLKA
jgi:hypothetical protein